MTLEFGAVGEKFFETGVSRVILFVGSDAGVVWNGVQNVVYQPQGGESHSYYFDGVKYLETVDAEDFQATITALQAPSSFRRCEGTLQLGGENNPIPGMYVPGTGYRDKFHLVWRTQIGNDVNGPDHGYLLHIAYNGVVQPSEKNYATLGDVTNPDIRAWTFKTTPACGRFSYFVFDSTECDLTALEEQLNNGVLISCADLPNYVGATGIGCPSIMQDFESFQAGAILSAETVTSDDDTLYQVITGLINPGIDLTDLPADGDLTVNDSDATETGTHPVLIDDDPATYIGSSEGDLGYTVGLPPLTNYKPDVDLELHITMSVSGGVDADTDDSELDADAQVFITTDVDGDIPVGGFSDGTDDGMSFALSDVDGNPVDYVVPLDMDAWLYTTQDDVGAALAAGAFLNIVAVNNNNPDTTPEVRVYEASVVQVDGTQESKSLRSVGNADASLEMHIYDSGTTDNTIQELTETVDFLATKVAYDSEADGYTQDIFDWRVISGTSPGALRLIPNGDGAPQLSWKADNGTTDLVTYVDVSPDTWYTAQADWTFGSMRIRVFDRDLSIEQSIFDHTEDTDMDPTAFVKFWAGYVGADGDSTINHVVFIDNASMKIHCDAPPPPPPEWIDIDLSTIEPFLSKAAQSWVPLNTPMAVYSGGQIHSNPDWGSGCTFSLPSFTLDPTKSYQFEVTYDTVGYQFGIMQQNPSWTSFSDNWELGYTFPTASVIDLTIGPGVDDWNSAITAGYQSLIRFDTSDGVVGLRYKEL